QTLAGERAGLLRLQPRDAASRNDAFDGRSVEALRPVAGLGEGQRKWGRLAADAASVARTDRRRSAVSEVGMGRRAHLHLLDERGRINVPHAGWIFVDAYCPNLHRVWCTWQRLQHRGKAQLRAGALTPIEQREFV